MKRKILILGASYGSLLGTKLAMAGHDVRLVCRSLTARLINAQGTEVRIRLRGEDGHRAIRSADLLVQFIARQLDMDLRAIDETVETVDVALEGNQLRVA